MEYLCVYKKHEDIKDNDLQCVKKWVRINIEGSDADVFKDREQKDYKGEVVVESDTHETRIHATTRKIINNILADGYEVDDDRPPAPNKN